MGRAQKEAIRQHVETGPTDRPLCLGKGPTWQNLLLLLLLNTAGVSGSLPVTVSGCVGEQVVLPCTYKGNAPVKDLQVLWHIFGLKVIHQFVNGSTQQVAQYRERIKLFKDQLEHGNWSVMLSDLRESDQNTYKCQFLKWTGSVYETEQDNLIHLFIPGSSPVTVSGSVAGQVVLPCTYKGNVPVRDLQVLWQIPGREVVHRFVGGRDDLTEQDPQFRERTNLFKDQLEHGNWSVMLSDLRKSDQNLYECQILKRKIVNFYLEQGVSVRLSVTGG
uniref:butyrophilin subfamily 1 member A1-like isoform X2 n=1 Tax=Pristiophorus japonicus TaxID=55135 RepID=UPI00398F6B20